MTADEKCDHLYLVDFNGKHWFVSRENQFRYCPKCGERLEEG